MKMRGRVKPIARWTAWVLAVLLPAMWIVSLFVTARAQTPLRINGDRLRLVLGEGCLFADNLDSSKNDVQISDYTKPTVHAIRFPRVWLPHVGSIAFVFIAVVPLWIPWIVILCFATWFFFDHRREKMRRLNGRCPGCGYSRVGLAPNVPCPECGSLPTPEGSG